ncbi:MAG: hypothetical protein SH850_16525 [Planctomycetaceae bacterium]|nr:hypothetical protein [Planctomycetaceae bacterium]
MRHFSPWRPQWCGASGLLCRVVVALLCVVTWTASDVAAQPGGFGQPGGKQPAPKKTGGKVLPNTKPGPKGKGPAKPADTPLNISPDKLPDGYVPPPATPELMTLEEPLLTEEEYEASRNLSPYKNRMRKGDLAKEDKDIIDKGLKYRLYVMTLKPNPAWKDKNNDKLKDNERDLHKRRDELTQQDLRTAGTLQNKAENQLAFRKYVLQEIVKLAEPLLKNNFYVRLQAVTLLGELELVPADPIKNIKLETFTPACEPLIRVLEDPDQPPPVKIAAARSLVRLCKFAGVNLPPVELRHRIAKSTLAELAKTDTHYWYQMRLIEVLAALDITLDLQARKPLILAGLLNVLNDPQRDWHARAEAAWALGRVPFDPAQTDVPAVMRDLMQFALDLTKAAQQAPTDPKWKTCLFKVYLAFQPVNAEDREATRRTRAGLLNSPLTTAQSLAQEPYKLIVPIVNDYVINGKPITAQQIQAIDAWVQKNKQPAQANVNNGAAAQAGP